MGGGGGGGEEVGKTVKGEVYQPEEAAGLVVCTVIL